MLIQMQEIILSTQLDILPVSRIIDLNVQYILF